MPRGAGEVGFDGVEQGGGEIGRDRLLDFHVVAENDRAGRADVGADIGEPALGLAARAMVIDHGKGRDAFGQGAGCRRGGDIGQDDRVEIFEGGIVPLGELEIAAADEDFIDAAGELIADRHLNVGVGQFFLKEEAERPSAGQGVGIGIAMRGDENILFVVEEAKEVSEMGAMTRVASGGLRGVHDGFDA